MARALATLSITTLLAFAGASAQAENAISPYGAQTCRQWVQLHQTPTAAETMATDGWILGHVEAKARFINAGRELKGLPPSNMLQGFDRTTVMELVERFCMGNPQRTLDETVAALSAQMIASEPQVVRRTARR